MTEKRPFPDRRYGVFRFAVRCSAIGMFSIMHAPKPESFGASGAWSGRSVRCLSLTAGTACASFLGLSLYPPRPIARKGRECKKRLFRPFFFRNIFEPLR